MAPFSRGSGPKGRISKGKSNQPRGKSSAVHRGRGFTSARLKDVEALLPDDSTTTLPEDLEMDDMSEASSEEGGDDVERNSSSVDLYRSLLQTLGVNERSPATKQADHAAQTQKQPQQELLNLDPDPLEVTEEVGVENEDLEADSDIDESSATNDYFNQHFNALPASTLELHAQEVAKGSRLRRKLDLDTIWKAVVNSTSASADSTSDPFPHITHRQSVPHLNLKQRIRAKGDSMLAEAKGIELYLTEMLFSYRDILFSERLHINTGLFRQIAALHSLNHVLKTRDRVVKNNERAAQDPDLDDDKLCDQGFTRPKVLFLLPTRQSCFEVVNTITTLYKPEQQENRKRFQDTYGDPGEPISQGKPQDFQELFRGNDDDMFRIGLKFTRKTIKFFAQFYSSDIILASPLGLRMVLGDSSTKKQDYDFLSSIEVVILDQTEALLMQNWEHVEYIFDHLNLQPREAHGFDLRRVRPWYLDDHARFVRQTVMLSAYDTPEINSLFNSKMQNVSGRYKINKSNYGGIISAPNALFKQTFYRFEAASPSLEPDARFQYFTGKVVPQLLKRVRNEPGRVHGILIFIPSYTDFVRVRNFFADSITMRDIAFGSLSEYTTAPDIARARSHFMKGRHSVVIYSGRLHHFRRYQIKGTKQTVFYSLPDNPIFYQELGSDYPALGVSAGKVDAAEIETQALFSRFDALRLERIVGTERVRRMIRESSGDVFEFIP